MTPGLHLGDAEVIARIALAVFLGGAIGVEREINAQPAGFRTHVVLCLGATLFGLISAFAFAGAVTNGTTNVRIDPTRVASQVVVGVGFLGGGAILKQEGGVRGLTTAASLWVTAAIGLAVGIGYYTAAIATTVATLGSLAGLRGTRRWIRRRLAREEEQVTFRLVPAADPSEFIAELSSRPRVQLRRLQVSIDEETRAVVVEATLKGEPGVSVEQTLRPLADRDDVEEMVLSER